MNASRLAFAGAVVIAGAIAARSCASQPRAGRSERMTVDVTETRGATGTPLVPEAPAPPAPPAPPEPESRIANHESRTEKPAAPLAEAEVPTSDRRIRGRAILDGPIPRRRRVDAYRFNVNVHDEAQIVHRENRGIRNVFVYVRKVEGKFEVPRDAVEMSFCDFRIGPHVVGARAGQDVAVSNLDNEVQNLHARPKRSKECNFAQKPGMRDVFRFENVEVMVEIRCDIHPWERAYVGVLAHPYFSVTDDNGAFELPEIAPGAYDLVAWHEIYGELAKHVVVGERTDPVEFIFVHR